MTKISSLPICRSFRKRLGCVESIKESKFRSREAYPFVQASAADVAAENDWPPAVRDFKMRFEDFDARFATLTEQDIIAGQVRCVHSLYDRQGGLFSLMFYRNI